MILRRTSFDEGGLARVASGDCFSHGTSNCRFHLSRCPRREGRILELGSRTHACPTLLTWGIWPAMALHTSPHHNPQHNPRQPTPTHATHTAHTAHNANQSSEKGGRSSRHLRPVLLPRPLRTLTPEPNTGMLSKTGQDPVQRSTSPSPPPCLGSNSPLVAYPSMRSRMNIYAFDLFDNLSSLSKKASGSADGGGEWSVLLSSTRPMSLPAVPKGVGGSGNGAAISPSPSAHRLGGVSRRRLERCNSAV